MGSEMKILDGSFDDSNVGKPDCTFDGSNDGFPAGSYVKSLLGFFDVSNEGKPDRSFDDSRHLPHLGQTSDAPINYLTSLKSASQQGFL